MRIPAVVILAWFAASGLVWAVPCPDGDGDGFADCTVPGCDAGGLECGDCDDAVWEVHPGAFEECNHRDDDCTGGVDDGYPGAVRGERHLDLRPAAGATLGSAVAAVGDLDGDGLDDFVAGAPADDRMALDAGLLVAYSGADRRMLWRAPWNDALSRLGTSLAGAGDLDGDGVPDILAGFPGDERIGLFSGVDGSWIANCVGVGGGSLGADHGVAAVGDQDGDGVSEIAGGSQVNNERLHHQGKVTVFRFDRATGACAIRFQLWDPTGAIYDNLGASVAGLDDLDGDGVPDFAAGAPGAAAARDNAGIVVVFSGATGAIVRRLIDPAGGTNDNLGIDLHGIEDLDGDGIGEVVASTERRNAWEGEVVVFSGTDGAVLRRLTDGASVTAERLGNAIDVVPDVDGDRFDDVLAGARYATLGGVTNCGRAVVLSSATGAVLASVEPEVRVASAQFGWAVAGVGDLTGDGIPEFAVGAPGDGPATAPQCGSVSVAAFESVCDDDGRSPFEGDCDDTDASVWGVPSEVLDVSFASGKSILRWTEPADPGGTAPPRYDTLRSTSAANLGSAECLESGDDDCEASDVVLPVPGGAHYYVVRPIGPGCGPGSLGAAGTLLWPREAPACP